MTVSYKWNCYRENNDNAIEMPDDLEDEIPFIRLISDWSRMAVFRII